MRYMGSKGRISKHILSVMMEYRKPGQWWVEPFVGGGNLIDKVTGNRIGSDYNKWAISALKSIRDCLDELPNNNQEFTEEDYKALRKSDDYKHKGYVGFSCSWGGKWLGGYAKDSKGDDYVASAKNSATRQSKGLQGVELFHCSYDELDIPPNSLIYCDPPYINTTSYATGNFDHNKFFNWCRTKGSEGHTVFLSEYTAPDDFKCIWEKEISNPLKRTADNSSYGVYTEKLFTLNPKKIQTLKEFFK